MDSDKPLEEIEINSLGTKELISKDTKELYMILFPNIDNDCININDYQFDIPFPVFTIEGKNKHSEVKYDGDINYDQDFNELEFSRFGISISKRREINDHIKNGKSIIKINDLLPYSFDDSNMNESYRVHFINCSNMNSFNELYRSKLFYIDCDVNEDVTVNELLEKGFNNETSILFENGTGIKSNNGIKHSSMNK